MRLVYRAGLFASSRRDEMFIVMGVLRTLGAHLWAKDDFAPDGAADRRSIKIAPLRGLAKPIGMAVRSQS